MTETSGVMEVSRVCRWLLGLFFWLVYISANVNVNAVEMLPLLPEVRCIADCCDAAAVRRTCSQIHNQDRQHRAFMPSVSFVSIGEDRCF